MRPIVSAGLIAAALLAAPGLALAQDAPEVQAQRRALNETQADLVAAQTADYEARKAAIAAQQAVSETEYRHATERYEARVAEREAQIARDRAQWRADVTLCKAGELAKCEPESAPGAGAVASGARVPGGGG